MDAPGRCKGCGRLSFDSDYCSRPDCDDEREEEILDEVARHELERGLGGPGSLAFDESDPRDDDFMDWFYGGENLR